MAPEELISAVRRHPFAPFRLTLTEGSSYDVRHPELCMVGRRAVILGLVAPNAPDPLFERSVTVDLLHVVKLEPLEAPEAPKPNGPA